VLLPGPVLGRNIEKTRRVAGVLDLDARRVAVHGQRGGDHRTHASGRARSPAR
jgi:hypothetical protein